MDLGTFDADWVFVDGGLHVGVVHYLSCSPFAVCNTFLCTCGLRTSGSLCVLCALTPNHLHRFSGTRLGGHCDFVVNCREYAAFSVFSTTSEPQGKAQSY